MRHISGWQRFDSEQDDRMIRWCLGLLAILSMPVMAQAERAKSASYIFGNSLVHHLSEANDNTNIAHWINALAKEDGREYAVSGQWGFMRKFAQSLPPNPNWSFPGVKHAVPSGAFRAADLDAVIVTPANFIQYQPANAPYDGENPTGTSPLQVANDLFSWVEVNQPSARLMIYEGWADMATVTNYPPNTRGMRKYQRLNAGSYHDWFTDFVSQLEQAGDGRRVELIPVASILAQLIGKGGLLENMPAQALYEDDAPHGTPELYLLAGMITYAALFDAPPPASYQPPATMHPDLVTNYPQIAETIWQSMPQDKYTQAATTQSAPVADLPKRQPITLPPSGLRPDGVPVLAMGLNGISDWSSQHPFLDIMKSSRPWVGHLPGQWGGISNEQLRRDGHLDAQGWPVSIPANAKEGLESVILTSQHQGAQSLRGRYVVLYEGKGTLRLSGLAKRTRYEPGRISFDYTPGARESLVSVKITKTDPNDHIRNIRVIKQDHLPLYQAGALFNPRWIETIQDLRSVRFMDWMLTNGSPVSTWSERPRMDDASWVQRGVPLEVMIRLSNRIGADPWFNMPHRADDDYARRLAQAVKRDLRPDLKTYVEYSNEVWNRIFPQATWARENATQLWGDTRMGAMQFYGMRAAQIMDIWSEVYGDQRQERLIRVVGTQTGWFGMEEHILISPLGYLRLGKTPRDSFDAYAVTGYFGYEMGTDEMAATVNGWLDQAEALATKAGQAQGLKRVALREFVKKTRFEAAIAPMAEALAEGSLRRLTEESFPYHAAAARKNGLQLVMYEGGTHVTGHGAQINDERMSNFFNHFSYTPEMAKLYEQLLAGWVAAGGTLFNGFVDVAPETKWGSWGAKRFLDDANPRWDMLMAFNAVGQKDWDNRSANSFADGITRIAGSGNQRLQGTSRPDILIAGSGKDTMISAGGFDILHGGAGRDRAVLPGAQADYSFARNGTRLIATGPKGQIWLTDIEELTFEAALETVIQTQGL
jgi:hypothetical protein